MLEVMGGLAFCDRLADAFLGPRQHCSGVTAEVHQFFDHGCPLEISSPDIRRVVVRVTQLVEIAWVRVYAAKQMGVLIFDKPAT